MLREIRLRLWKFYGRGRSPRGAGRPVSRRVESQEVHGSVTQEAAKVLANEFKREAAKRSKKVKVYELAKNLKEAKELRDAGFGYETRASAQRALAEDKQIDSYYRNLLKVFELENR